MPILGCVEAPQSDETGTADATSSPNVNVHLDRISKVDSHVWRLSATLDNIGSSAACFSPNERGAVTADYRDSVSGLQIASHDTDEAYSVLLQGKESTMTGTGGKPIKLLPGQATHLVLDIPQHGDLYLKDENGRFVREVVSYSGANVFLLVGVFSCAESSFRQALEHGGVNFSTSNRLFHPRFPLP